MNLKEHPRRLLALALALLFCFSSFAPVSAADLPGEVWDVAITPITDYAAQGFATSVGTAVKFAAERIGQNDDYVNVNKPGDTGASTSVYLITAGSINNIIPNAGVPFTLETTVRTAGEVVSQRNEVSVRSTDVGQSVKLSGFYLEHGGAGVGRVVALGNSSKNMTLDTTVWHDYRLLVNADRTSTLYVDGVLAWENDDALSGGNKTSTLVKFGADIAYRCNMDVKALRVASGHLTPPPKPGINSIELSATSGSFGEAVSLAVTVLTTDLDGQNILAELETVTGIGTGITASGTVTDGTAELALSLPDTLDSGTYRISVTCAGQTKFSQPYVVRETLSDEPPVFPKFVIDGYTIEMANYKYNPNNEFNFPSIVDTKLHPVTNTLGGRYYLFYSPHDAPGGICLATSNSLWGPWKEYEGNPVVSKNWPPNYNVSHVSSSDVLWNEEAQCYFMYFHGENTVTRYATSNDLVSWTYGGECVHAEDFAPGNNNASYSRVTRYAVPGKWNYIMTTMVAKYGANNNSIYYAHSMDGINWTAVTTVLVDPDRAPEIGYGGKLSGAVFMEWGGRYFVICHGASGNIYAIEVGQNLDQQKDWGMIYDSVDGEPDMGRAAAPCFIQDDAGQWHMFYESGKRLHNNIVHATEVGADGVLFRDDFNGGSADGWVTEGGTWTVADGAYFQSNKSGSAMAFAGDTAWTDYEVEVKVTPVETSKSVAVMISGRADGAANRYIGAYNAGNLTINRRIGGSDSVLATGTYNMTVGTTYTMKLVFRGSQIALYVNGVMQLEATDSTHKSGKIGLVTYNTSAKFDDVVVRALSNDPEPAGPIKVTDFGDHQVIQRDPDTKRADVTFSGTVFAAAAKVEVRVSNFETDADVVGWTAVARNVAEGSPWSGSLPVPQGGWYKLEARALDGDGKVLSSAVGAHKWGVGINVLCIGQSNMVGQASGLPRTVANDLVANYTRAGNWTHLVDPYDGAGGSLVPAMGNHLVQTLGIPVGFIPAADSGSGLHAPNPYTNPPHGPTRYWMYYTTPSDTSTLYGKAVTRAKAAGGVELAVWNQGETDGAISVAKEVYESDMKTLLGRLRADLGNSNLPIFLCQIGTHDTNISNDADYTAIRSAQHDLDDGVNFFLAATEMEFARKDTAHYTQPGLNEIGRRVANSVLFYLGRASYYRGPYISCADYADATRKVIDVKITHRGGNDISTTGEITGFSVLDGTQEAVITSAVRQGPDTVRLTLAAPITGSGQLRYLYGLNPPHSNIIKDNTAMALPLENTTADIPVGADTPADYVPPIYDDSVTTQTKTLPDGTRVTTKTDRTTGTATVTTLAPDGGKTVTVTKKDGSGTETLTRADGVRTESKIAADGSVTAAVTVPAALGKAVVELPAGKGNVAVAVRADGTERVLTLFTLQDGRLKVLLDGPAEIRVIARGAAFADTEGTAAHEAAAQLAARNMFLGTGADTFSPNLAVNRAMLATLLHRLDGRPEAAPAIFADVPENAWFAAGAGWAQARGITLGVGGGSFAPDAALTWEQLAVMLYRYASVDAGETAGTSETQLALDWCAGVGVGLGLDRSAPVRRGELAVMLYDYIKALVG